MNRKLLTMAVAGLLSVAGLSAQEPQLKWVTSQDGMGLEIPPVSYTHLTLPTILLV